MQHGSLKDAEEFVSGQGHNVGAAAPPKFVAAGVEIRDAPNAGRGVFTMTLLAKGTELLVTSRPTVSVLYRDYRKEVCHECFAYDHGRSWKLRDSQTAVVWCSEQCESLWRSRHGQQQEIEAMVAVEHLVTKSKKSSDNGGHHGKSDVVMLDMSGGPPSAEQTEQAWHGVQETGEQIVQARCTATSASKALRKLIAQALAKPVVPEVLGFQLSCILTWTMRPAMWAKTMELVADDSPHPSVGALEQHTDAYLHLCCVLPRAILPACHPHIIRAALARDAVNSFGIRSLDDGGSEMFGHGVWPEASYWNHSCTPNVSKERINAGWRFWLSTSVQPDHQLFISYLGGDERELTLKERRARLAEVWGFRCECTKCMAEQMQDSNSS